MIYCARRHIVCGPAACGKTTLARALGERLEIPMVEGDEFHSPHNIEKMRRNLPLTAEDRAPWIASLIEHCKKMPEFVLACSALTFQLRTTLREALPGVVFWVPVLDSAELHRRVASRAHFFPATLLQSQLDTWEPPGLEEAENCLFYGPETLGLVQDPTIPQEVWPRMNF